MMKSSKSMMFLIVSLALVALTNVACIEDGPLNADPTPDAGVVPTGACAGKANGTVCRESVASCDQPEFCDGVSNDCPADSMEPNGTLCLCSDNAEGTCNGTSPTCNVVVVVDPIPCHGLLVGFTPADVANIQSCTGWTSTGAAIALTPSSEVVGGNLVCAITCNKKVGEGNVVPSAVSGIWLPGATSDVLRWTKGGCKRLPDHPAAEADQAGGAWDGRCDKY